MKNYFSFNKTCILFFFFFLSFFVSSAQFPIDNKLIPENVKKNFTERFPKAGAVVWIQPSPGFLETTFSLDKHSVTAVFSMGMGDCISVDTKLKKEEFPIIAYGYILKVMPDGKIINYYKSELIKGTEYYSEVKQTGIKYIFTFDKDGNFKGRMTDE